MFVARRTRCGGDSRGAGMIVDWPIHVGKPPSERLGVAPFPFWMARGRKSQTMVDGVSDEY
jgi:hypothetical protein